MKRLALFLGAGILAASCTSNTVPQKTDTDDLYVKSGDLVLPGAVASTQQVSTLPYDDSYDPISDGFEGGSDEYFDENFLTSKDLKRKNGNVAGYSDGYADGYSQGWSDNAWTYNSRNRFWGNYFYGFNSPYYAWSGSSLYYSYSPWGSRFGFNFGGFYDPWDPFYNYYGWNSLAYGWGGYYGGYPYFGYNNFYSRLYNPYGGYYDYYGYVGPYRPIYYVNNYNGRTVRQRNASVASSRYNDRIVNRTAMNNARVANSNRSAVNRNASASRMSATEANRSSISRGTSSRNASAAPRSYDSYNNRNARVQTSSRTAPSSYGRSSTGNSNSSYGRSSNNTYSRPTEGARMGGSRTSSPSYSSPSSRTSSPSYSAPSRSSSSSSGGSSGSSSRSTSSGGSSRGRG
ncbi:hypothetical protein Lbys_3034 [Leadbetterella byssophila DSM 17132]|uniref:Vitellogenin II n=1 Tax=Leadbetterella byssophila (strain DSM 17132 / JCM 16389 / KACC 11308 / NBRC 106382 / 4M15) TaxID=649349 RepID=E4RTY8_LEAB4|nr:hypothetical protein [Leadbetterella byssophila]ADQ18696.1 hypothetical protein Lbys_3034 [Leadbetterella byssophila DSM 17132]